MLRNIGYHAASLHPWLSILSLAAWLAMLLVGVTGYTWILSAMYAASAALVWQSDPFTRDEVIGTPLEIVLILGSIVLRDIVFINLWQ